MVGIFIHKNKERFNMDCPNKDCKFYKKKEK
nr:MAG TPA: hypothetical protein [Caudoviricetes sp.]